MGSGSSVLTPELASKLEPESLDKLKAAQDECSSRHMDSEMTYQTLTQKYNTLIKEQEMKKGHVCVSSDAEQNAMESPIKRPRPIITRRNCQLDEEIFLAELKKVLEADDIHKIETAPDFDGHYTLQSVERALGNEHIQSHSHDLTWRQSDLSHTTCSSQGRRHSFDDNNSNADVKSVVSDTGAPYSSAVGNGGSDGLQHHHEEGHFECHLCKTSFDSRHAMEQHIDHSEMHRKSIQKRAHMITEAHEEAVRLTGIAQNILNGMSASAGDHAKPATLNPIIPKTESELLAERGFTKGGKKVPTPRTVANVKASVVAEQQAADRAHAHAMKQLWRNAAHFIIQRQMKEQFRRRLSDRVETPKGVVVIYEGSKYFYRTNNTYNLIFFMHCQADILEIVPHYVPFNHDTSQIEETAENFFEPAKRIYLVYSELYKAFMGAHDPHGMHSRMGVEPDDVLGHVPKLLRSNSLAESEHKALGLFISNRLKIHKSHARTDAIFFDLHGINHRMLIGEGCDLPARFEPTSMSPDRVRHCWNEKWSAAPVLADHGISVDEVPVDGAKATATATATATALTSDCKSPVNGAGVKEVPSTTPSTPMEADKDVNRQ